MKNPLVIIYLIDGARPDVMQELLESGDLLNIQREVVNRGTFRTACSCLPSTTGPAYLPFLTGCFPGTINIPGIRWLDKVEFKSKNFGKNRFRSYMGLGAARVNQDLALNHPTLYELFQKPFNIYSMITRGLPKGHNLTSFSKPFLYLYAHLSNHWHPIDRAAHHYLLNVLDQNPDLIFAVFPGVDSYSHLNHPRHQKVLEAYRFADFSVGQVAEKLRHLGRWEETLLIITSDHGLTATHRHLDLAAFFQKRGLSTMYYPVIWKFNPKLSVMISGNALGHVYFLDGAGSEPILGEKVKDFLGDSWQELLSREEIDFVAWRESKQGINIKSSKGQALITKIPQGYSYAPLDGDPFGLGKIETSLDKEKALEITFNSDYPDALVQIEQLFTSPRSGDLIVVSKNGSDLRQNFEWPEHHSSHGSLHRQHTLVPFIYNQTGWYSGPVRTVDIFNTVLKWSGKPVPENTDGRPLC